MEKNIGINGVIIGGAIYFYERYNDFLDSFPGIKLMTSVIGQTPIPVSVTDAKR